MGFGWSDGLNFLEQNDALKLERPKMKKPGPILLIHDQRKV
jgi:hypothetical protein